MAINFKDFADDKTSGQIGLVMCLASSVVAIGISYVTDHLRKHIKLTLVILLVLEFLSFLWLTLICAKVIPFRYLFFLSSNSKDGFRLENVLTRMELFWFFDIIKILKEGAPSKSMNYVT